MVRRSSTGTRPRLSELTADDVKASAANALNSMDAILHSIKLAVQIRDWGTLEEEWHTLETFMSEASVPVAELHRRVKAIGRVPGRGRSPRRN